MTTHDTVPGQPSVDDPAELDRFLTSYAPSGLSTAQWRLLAPAAIEVVKRAGVYKRARVEKDIQALGLVAEHLIARGRPLTLDEALADATLLDFDVASERARASGKTRENKLGILRRLQAVHHGVPWRRDRRPDGERVNDLPGPELAAELERVVTAAGRSSDAGAVELLAAVEIARRARHGEDAKVTSDMAQWQRARAFASRNGMELTARILAAAVTHEVLLNGEPVAVIAASARLTQRDLDLGLTHATALAGCLSDEHRAALRGV